MTISEALEKIGMQSLRARAREEGFPKDTRLIIEKVSERPSDPWPLDVLGKELNLQPFVASRRFKQDVGVGFHEFVDRARTEIAVLMLAYNKEGLKLDVIASTCGFGTTQGLKESIKEYLAPSKDELKNLLVAIQPDPMHAVSVEVPTTPPEGVSEPSAIGIFEELVTIYAGDQVDPKDVADLLLGISRAFEAIGGFPLELRDGGTGKLKTPVSA